MWRTCGEAHTPESHLCGSTVHHNREAGSTPAAEPEVLNARDARDAGRAVLRKWKIEDTTFVQVEEMSPTGGISALRQHSNLWTNQSF